ncbi:hypothetical protein ACE1AQ_01995 [Microcystis sp. BLCC-F209]|nr:hypothetical protein BFG60_4907 [Microcystis aeruginosa NIES-98]
MFVNFIPYYSSNFSFILNSTAIATLAFTEKQRSPFSNLKNSDRSN